MDCVSRTNLCKPFPQHLLNCTIGPALGFLAGAQGDQVISDFEILGSIEGIVVFSPRTEIGNSDRLWFLEGFEV